MTSPPAPGLMDMESRPACIVLIYGIPGSGKTLLTRHLSFTSARRDPCEGEHASVVGSERDWETVPVHFDDFLPPDLRLHARRAPEASRTQCIYDISSWGTYSNYTG